MFPVTLVLSVRATARNLYSQIVTSFVDSDVSLYRNMNALINAADLDGTKNEKNTRTSHFAFILICTFDKESTKLIKCAV